jgi:hypothetical protein
MAGIICFAISGSCSEIPNNCRFLKLTFFEDVFNVFINSRDGFSKKLSHLFLGEPDGIFFEMYRKRGCSIRGLVQDNSIVSSGHSGIFSGHGYSSIRKVIPPKTFRRQTF